MKQSITQEHDYGCGVACFAFVTDNSYQQAVQLLGRDTSVAHGWRPADLVRELTKLGYAYKSCYVRKNDYVPTRDGTIILIERSAAYPVGHYFVYVHGKYMDPWINLLRDNSVNKAKSGFRDTLPGKAMYVLEPRD